MKLTIEENATYLRLDADVQQALEHLASLEELASIDIEPTTGELTISLLSKAATLRSGGFSKLDVSRTILLEASEHIKVISKRLKPKIKKGRPSSRWWTVERDNNLLEIYKNRPKGWKIKEVTMQFAKEAIDYDNPPLPRRDERETTEAFNNRHAEAFNRQMASIENRLEMLRKMEKVRKLDDQRIQRLVDMGLFDDILG